MLKESMFGSSNHVLCWSSLVRYKEDYKDITADAANSAYTTEQERGGRDQNRYKRYEREGGKKIAVDALHPPAKKKTP